jgi:glutamine---fructose-6-phosphate transaminase (isomerizing)
MLALASEVSARGGDVLLLSDATETPIGRLLHLPFTLDEWLMPLAAIVPGQLLALYVAQARTSNVDQPRGLNKVTLTT